MKRKVICCDAFERLEKIKPVKTVITSLPDASEVECRLADYENWFTKGASLTMRAVTDDGVAIFYQGDRKHHGVLLSKATLLCNTAGSLGLRLLWHKIVLRNPVGAINLFRPSYLHMLAFSKALRSGNPSPDVIEAGKTIYRNAMGVNAATIAVRFAIKMAKARTIYDPFCGRGTVLAVANALDCNSVGYDVDEEECVYARQLVLKLG
jgi:DNA methylase